MGGPRHVWFTPESDRGADVDRACVVVSPSGITQPVVELICALFIRFFASALQFR